MQLKKQELCLQIVMCHFKVGACRHEHLHVGIVSDSVSKDIKEIVCIFSFLKKMEVFGFLAYLDSFRVFLAIV
jgi:hypothetical protein